MHFTRSIGKSNVRLASFEVFYLIRIAELIDKLTETHVIIDATGTQTID